MKRVIPASKVTIIQVAEIQAALGMSDEEFAQDLGVKPDTVKGWRNRAKMGDNGYINRYDLNIILISHMINLNAEEEEAVAA